MSHATSSEMAIDESKKRQKEETTPNSMTRQPKNKKKEDEKKDGDNTRKELFPEKEADSTYKTYYKKENLRKKEPRWNQHLATIEERTMQASTPHTAKKQAASTNTDEDLSKTLQTQIQEAKQTMARIQESMTSQEQPQYIQEMQQQLRSLQENVQKLEKSTENLRRELTDVDILTQHVHDTLYTQQQRDAARQTVAKGWPKDFSDEERDAVIKWYMEKANVDNHYTTTHGRYMHGRYKRSQITIIHWKEDWAKQAFENYVYKWYNKRNPVRIWDRNNQTVYYGNEPHRISFVPQTSDMEREINLTIQAALHIVTKHEGSDLANSWNKVAVKWQDKLAVRIADNAVIFKLIRDKEDAKFMYLHIHRDYFEVINDGWSKGWAEANCKTKCPEYDRYTYMLKLAVLRDNEEYYTMRNAKWGPENDEEL